MAATMFHNGLVLVYLLIASLVATTTVHACELPGVVALECFGAVHAGPDKDSKKPPSGEADQGAMHHHGCHSASTFLAGSADTDVVFAPSPHSYALLRVTALLPRDSSPGLRPPIV